jgi:peroxiredoxin
MRTDSDGKTSKPMSVWRDTLYVRQGETYVVRSRFKDFLGKTVIHCHFLDHEDQGMMMPIEFIPPYQAPKPAEVVARAPALAPMAAPAPAVALADPDGNVHELAGLRPRSVILVFFLGLECKHCADQLGRLLREGRDALGPDVEIVAVSSRAVVDPAKALKQLGVRPGDRFRLLVDPDRKAFRAFGCEQDGPRHGLFLLDGSGVIRAGYTGGEPLDDPRSAFAKLRSLAK